MYGWYLVVEVVDKDLPIPRKDRLYAELKVVFISSSCRRSSIAMIVIVRIRMCSSSSSILETH